MNKITYLSSESSLLIRKVSFVAFVMVVLIHSQVFALIDNLPTPYKNVQVFLFQNLTAWAVPYFFSFFFIWIVSSLCSRMIGFIVDASKCISVLSGMTFFIGLVRLGFVINIKEELLKPNFLYRITNKWMPKTTEILMGGCV